MDVQFGPAGFIRTVTANGEEAVGASAGVIARHIQSQTRRKSGLYALASLSVVIAALLVVLPRWG